MANSRRVRNSQTVDSDLAVGNNLTVGGNVTVTGTIAGSIAAPRSVTTTDTATINDQVLLLSGASFTQNLYTAVGNAGRELTIKHNGTSLTQQYTIDPNGGQTIDGAATYILSTNGETVRIVSDGSNWQIVDHKTTRTENFTMIITADVTPPTRADVYTEVSTWSRNGKWMRINYKYLHTSSTGSAVGSGNYRYNIPGGLTIDSSLLPPEGNFASGVCGSFGFDDDSNRTAGYMHNYDNTSIVAVSGNATLGTLHQSDSFLQMGGATVNRISFDAVVPILEWND